MVPAMLRRCLCTGVVAVLVLAMLPAGAPHAKVGRHRYIVVLDEGANPRTVARAHGVRAAYVYRHALQGFAGRFTAAQVARLRGDDRVRAVARDRRVSLDAQLLPTGVDRVDAEQSPTADIDGRDDAPVDADIAILDTGVDLEHPDLNVVGGINCVAPEPHLGRYDDLQGHGTHVAGTAAAIDNGQYVVGVAPGARIWSVRVLNGAGLGFTSQIVCGIDWVTAHADTIEVANMSLGGAALDNDGCATTADVEHVAICASVAAGVTYTVSAGNSATDAVNASPANYDEVITVSALADFDGEPGGEGDPTCRSDEDDTLASFSNFGPEVDLIAPGVCIVSTASTHDSRYGKDGLAAFSGTSMAAPHAAGAAALYLSTHPNATPAEVRTALRQAGTTSWNAEDDGDAMKEPLLNVAGF